MDDNKVKWTRKVRRYLRDAFSWLDTGLMLNALLIMDITFAGCFGMMQWRYTKTSGNYRCTSTTTTAMKRHRTRIQLSAYCYVPAKTTPLSGWPYLKTTKPYSPANISSIYPLRNNLSVK